MAKKSKTQRAKASARRAEKREQALAVEEFDEEFEQEAAEETKKANKSFKEVKAVDKPASQAKEPKEIKKKEPGRIATFINGVRSEMKRVTWPSRTDVIRWSGVVVGALIFFGVYVFVLDNYVVTPILLAISSLGA